MLVALKCVDTASLLDITCKILKLQTDVQKLNEYYHLIKIKLKE